MCNKEHNSIFLFFGKEIRKSITRSPTNHAFIPRLQHEDERNNDNDKESNKQPTKKVVVHDVASADHQQHGEHHTKDENNPQCILVSRDEE